MVNITPHRVTPEKDIRYTMNKKKLLDRPPVSDWTFGNKEQHLSATRIRTADCPAHILVPIHIVRQEAVHLLKSTGHVMHQQFNIQQLYVLPTLYLCVLYLSENKQRLVPLTA